jgi:hypothetical protein
MARALTLAAEGRARAAREALLLGQRFVRAAEVLASAGAAAAARNRRRRRTPTTIRARSWSGGWVICWTMS